MSHLCYQLRHFFLSQFVFMINSSLLISRPSLYLSVPVMMLTCALAFPPFPHVFIDNATSPLDLHYAKVKPSSLGLGVVFFSYASQGKKTEYGHVWGLGVWKVGRLCDLEKDYSCTMYLARWVFRREWHNGVDSASLSCPFWDCFSLFHLYNP